MSPVVGDVAENQMGVVPRIRIGVSSATARSVSRCNSSMAQMGGIRRHRYGRPMRLRGCTKRIGQAVVVNNVVRVWRMSGVPSIKNRATVSRDEHGVTTKSMRWMATPD